MAKKTRKQFLYSQYAKGRTKKEALATWKMMRAMEKYKAKYKLNARGTPPSRCSTRQEATAVHSAASRALLSMPSARFAATVTRSGSKL